MKALIGIGVLIILALIFLYPGGSIVKAFYVVDEKDLVIVTRFGEVRSVKTSPGINAKVPFLDNVIRFDRRILRIDSAPIAMPDKEKQSLLIDSYARYRIIDPVQFRKTLQTELLARSRLGDIVTSALRAEIARRDRSEIIGAKQIQDTNGNPVLDEEGLPRIEGSESRSALLEQVVEGVRLRVVAQEATYRQTTPAGRDTFSVVLPVQITAQEIVVRDAPDGGVVAGQDIEVTNIDIPSRTVTLSLQEGEDVPAGTTFAIQYFIERDEPFGIEIVDVRIKRADFPDSVTPSIFTRMRAERNRIATRFRSEGDEEDLKIRADANRRREVILAEADRTGSQVRGEGEAEAIRILAEALEEDPEFFAFRRSLEAYAQVLNQGTTVILSADADIFQFLQSPGAGVALDGSSGAADNQ